MAERDRSRTMLTLSRGAPARIRHLAKDLQSFLPQLVSECKFYKKDSLLVLNDMASLKRCDSVIYFESRGGQDNYFWLSSGGITAKFRLHNVHTMEELNFVGNCMMFSRPILSFDAAFQEEPHLQLLQLALQETFYVPENHPKSKPFFDHVMHFGLTPDKRIWIRFYTTPKPKENYDGEEIGPRFVLEIVRILDGAFQGDVIYNNPTYVAPRYQRHQQRVAAALAARERNQEKQIGLVKKLALKKVVRPDPVGEIFNEEVNSKEALKLMAQIDKKKKAKSAKKRVTKKKA